MDRLKAVLYGKEHVISSSSSSANRPHKQTTNNQVTESGNVAEVEFIKNNADFFEWHRLYVIEEANDLGKLPKLSEWGKWLSTKDSFFLTFVEFFSIFCFSYKRGANELLWSLIPGYEAILEVGISEPHVLLTICFV